MEDRTITLTEHELEGLIEKAVSRALRDVGIIATDDESIEKRRRDFTFLHDLRKQKESIVGKIAAAIVTAVMAGVCVLLAIGIRGWLRIS
jgi:hypothetical protein